MHAAGERSTLNAKARRVHLHRGLQDGRPLILCQALPQRSLLSHLTLQPCEYITLCAAAYITCWSAVSQSAGGSQFRKKVEQAAKSYLQAEPCR